MKKLISILALAAFVLSGVLPGIEAARASQYKTAAPQVKSASYKKAKHHTKKAHKKHASNAHAH